MTHKQPASQYGHGVMPVFWNIHGLAHSGNWS